MSDHPMPIIRQISLLYRYSQRFFSNRLRGFPLDAGQLPMLLQLYRFSGLTQEELSKRLALDKGTTARGVALLIRSGLVERREDPADRRAYRLSPSKKALALEDALFEIPSALQEILFQGMGGEERRQAKELIGRMGENIATHFAEHPSCGAVRSLSSGGRANDFPRKGKELQ